MITNFSFNFALKMVGNMPFNHHNRKLILLINYKIKKKKLRAIYKWSVGMSAIGIMALLQHQKEKNTHTHTTYNTAIASTLIGRRCNQSESSNAIIVIEIRTLNMSKWKLQATIMLPFACGSGFENCSNFKLDINL